MKCAPACRDGVKLVHWYMTRANQSETNNTVLPFCFHGRYGVITNRSYVIEAYQLRNPRKVIYHIKDYYIPPLHSESSAAPSTESNSYTSIIASSCGAVVVVIGSIWWCVKKYQKSRQPPGRHVLLQVDNVNNHVI